jgi:hypothetical protein
LLEARTTAIDLTDPANPRLIWAGSTGMPNHGFGLSCDGHQLHIAESRDVDPAVSVGGLETTNVEPNELKIFDHLGHPRATAEPADPRARARVLDRRFDPPAHDPDQLQRPPVHEFVDEGACATRIQESLYALQRQLARPPLALEPPAQQMSAATTAG